MSANLLELDDFIESPRKQEEEVKKIPDSSSPTKSEVPQEDNTKAKKGKKVSSSKKNIKVVIKFRGGEVDTENLTPEQLKINQEQKSVFFDERTYVFSEALGPAITQAETYQVSCKEVISKVLEGYNGTIFVYGNSGSGKTYTMLGPDSVVEYLSSPDMQNQNIDPNISANFGIILRACTEIFELMNKSFKKGENVGYSMTAQYFEVYLEKIFDLVNYTGEGASLKTSKSGETFIDPMTKIDVRTPQDVCKILEIGQKHKKQSATHINDRSSRSHTIFLLEVLTERKDGITKKAKLNLIDLAGSEKYSKIGPSEERLKESTNINLSLLQLSNCIKSLSEGHKFVNFRSSKLTHYLKDTLSGNSNTVLICTGSHQKVNQSHTKMTLEFATRAQKVKTKPVATEEMSKSKMIKLIKKLKQEVLELKSIIEDFKTEGHTITTDDHMEEDKEDSDEEEDLPTDNTTYFEDTDPRDTSFQSEHVRLQESKIEDESIHFQESALFEEKFQELQAEKEELDEKVSALKEKISNLGEKLAEKNETIQSLEIKLECKSGFISNQNAKITEISSEKDKILQTLTTELEKLQEKCHKLTAELEISSKKSEILQTEITDLQSESTKEKAKLQGVCDDLNKRIFDSKLKLNNLESQLKTTNDQKEDLSKDVDYYKGETARYSKEKEEALAKNLELQSTISMITTEKDEIQRAKSHIEQDITSYKEKERTSCEEIAKLKTENAKLKEHLETEKQNIAEMKINHEFELKEKDKESELKILQSQLEEAKDSLSKDNEQLSGLLAQRDKFNEEFKQKDQHLHEKDLKIVHLTQIESKYGLLLTEKEGLEGSLKSATDKTSEIDAKLKNAELKISDIERTNKDLIEALKIKEELLAESEKRKDFLWNKGHEIKKLCQDKITIVERLTAELEKLKNEKQTPKFEKCQKCEQIRKEKIEAIEKATTDYTKLKRKIFWYEENALKHSDYDLIKEKSSKYLKEKERLDRENAKLKQTIIELEAQIEKEKIDHETLLEEKNLNLLNLVQINEAQTRQMNNLNQSVSSFKAKIEEMVSQSFNMTEVRGSIKSPTKFSGNQTMRHTTKNVALAMPGGHDDDYFDDEREMQSQFEALKRKNSKGNQKEPEYLKDLTDNLTPLHAFTMQDSVYDYDNFHKATKKKHTPSKKASFYPKFSQEITKSRRMTISKPIDIGSWGNI
ncbi:unnamed protein product [Moneuplotes crassus]|uniref:Kinesin motor domain-containing protein n=2 Tax=Euplotes crassus TaxID=5936 RepID=A0AAD1UH93_EUPCR|nr:unnamed protein product [Moneuplotes crassus]